MAETRIDELQTFLEVASLGSFAGAARRLGVSTSGVSKQVAALEERLGVRLFNRTTRRVSLTEVGREFVARGEGIVEELERLEADVQGLQATPRGTLRVSAPQDFGRLYLCGAMSRFAAEYPDLRVEFELTDRVVDVVEEGCDVAVRVAALVDSSLIVRRIGRCRRILCATPAYLDQYGRPESVRALERYNCIEYEYLASGSWSFVEEGRRRSFTPTGRLRTNAGWAMREMVLAGLGIALLPTFLIVEDLASGALESILPDRLDADLEFMAVIPHRKQLPAKVRVFVDYLVTSFAGESWMTTIDKERES
jgi:DNA-binding transcriptional LysR family regulator